MYVCKGKIKDLCRYQEIEGGHLSFFIGKDKSYMQNIIADIQSLNPLLTPNE